MLNFGEATVIISVGITGTNIEIEELSHAWRGISIPVVEPPI